MVLCILEVGKLLQDGIDEICEVVDFCCYYVQQVCQCLVCEELCGLIGECNELFYEGCGIFVCVSLWNFLLVIFFGQISVVLVVGNIVLVKLVEQISLIVVCIVELMFEVGLLKDVIVLLLGDGVIFGGVFCCDVWVVGVVFIGFIDIVCIINC